MALVDDIFDLQAAQGDAFARFPNMGHGLGRGLLALRGRRLFGQRFEGAFEDSSGELPALRASWSFRSSSPWGLRVTCMRAE